MLEVRRQLLLQANEETVQLVSPLDHVAQARCLWSTEAGEPSFSLFPPNLPPSPPSFFPHIRDHQLLSIQRNKSPNVESTISPQALNLATVNNT